ncbi:MAG: hypothetical protein ACTSRD_01900 [Promethearchaeota archaeon]
MIRKQYASTALIFMFFVQLVFVSVSLSPYFNSTIVNNVGSDGNSIVDTPLAFPSASDTADTWWNESYTHRLLVTIQEPNINQRANEPVEVYIEFEDGTHLIDSTRLVKYTTGTWTPMSFQLSNITDDSTYIQSFTMTFQITINLNETLEYYIYYSDDPGITAYSPVSSLVTNFDGTTASIDNGHYEIDFAEGSAIYNFEYEGNNYHSENSFGSLSKVLQPGETTYTTDSRGFITDWLLVGPFDEPTTWSSFASVSGYAHLDLTKDYSAGDYATEGNATTGLDPSKQWVEHHDTDYRINLGYIYPGTEDYVTGYAMVYVYTAVDLENIYLKVAADDGIGVIMDHKWPRLLYQHVTNPLGSADRYASAAFDLTQGWHSFIVFCEEAGGNWEFTMRFSTDATLRSLTDGTNSITNLTIAQTAQTEITNIDEIVSGPVYSQYELNWTDSQDMTVYDTLTFYENLNMWKCERTFHWDEYHVYPDNSSFSALNTYYDATNFDEFLYDNQRTFGLTNEIISQDYTLVRDFNGGNSLTTLGIFLTGIENGSQYISLDEINWTTVYESGTPSIINIVPGNGTNLNNSEGANPDSYTITMTFWEFLDDNVGIVDVTFGTTEDLFFNLDITCFDHDASYAVGINITLINASDPGVWNNPGVDSIITDENGEVHFERLKETDYDVNVIYEDFGKTLDLDTVSIGTLDSSQSIVIDELGLTRLDLNLQSTGTIPEPIIGANVTFHSSIAGSTELIGDIYSDSYGIASLYWSNLSATDNYTFGVTFLGDPKWVNVTSGFTENYTTQLESYNSLVVEEQVEDFSTSLLMESGLTMNSYTYGENFDIDVYYFYEVSGSPTAIDGATVTYTIPGYAYNELLVTNGTNGYYTATIDSSTLTTDTPLNIYVTATKPGYTPLTNITLLTLQPVPLVILSDTTNIEVNWLENFTVTVQLNDTFNDQLVTDGTVSYAVANNPTIYGDLVQLGDDYVLTMNSTTFASSGSYVLNLHGTSDEYTTPTAEISLRIRDIQTELNGTIFLQNAYDIYVTTNHNFMFEYTTGGTGISGADTLDWELQNNDNPLDYLSGSLVETSTSGMYELVDFDTSALDVGSYSLVVHIGANNYIERQSAINLNVLQIPIELVADITGNVFTAPKGDLINISLQLYDPVYESIISGATVTITYDGNTYDMVEIGTSGEYYHTVDTDAYKTLAADKIFEAEIAITVNDNYTIDAIPVTIQIRPPLGPFNVPLIYWLIGGGVAVIALGVFGVTKGIQYARIPWIIKQITITRKGIKKKSRFIPAKITRSLTEVIADDAEGAFSTLGLSLKGKKPGKEKGKPKGPETYKDLEEMGGNQ